MLPAERRNSIANYIKKSESVKVDDLARKFNVSAMTIRRDLQLLQNQNLITRTHGGATWGKLTIEVPYQDKSVSNRDHKRRIARYAASLVKDGQVVILDAGTTTMCIAKELTSKRKLVVVTSDIFITEYLVRTTDFKIFQLGGFIQNTTGASLGMGSFNWLQHIHADIGFVGSSSIDLQKGITTPTLEKAEIKKQMVDSSANSILVADSSKFNSINFFKICDLDHFGLVITDENLPEEVLEGLQARNIDVKLV